MADLTTTLGSLVLPNPVLTASGCAASGQELHQFFDVATLGAVVTKSIMTRPRSGRPTPRMAETPSGMLNSIGLQGPGIDAFVEKDLPWLAEHGARVVVSIAGGHTDEYVALARKLYGNPAVSMIEVNISCPNVESRGQVFACDPAASGRVIGAVRRAARPQGPGVRQALAGRRRHHRHRAGLRRGRSRRVVSDQHLARDGDRHGHAGPVLGGVTGGLSGRRSGRWRCAACGRCTRCCRTCRSSAWAASAPGWTRCSSSRPARPQCRWARRCSATRPRRPGCWPS